MRVSTPQGVSTQEVQEILVELLGKELEIIAQEKRHFVIACHGDEQVQALLALDGLKIDDQIVAISHAQYSMSGDELFQFVRRLLKTEEEMNLLRRSYGCGDSTPRSVKVVQSENPRSPSTQQKQAQNNTRQDDKNRRDNKDGKKKPNPSKEAEKGKDKATEKKTTSPATTSDSSGNNRKGDRNSTRDKGKCWVCEDKGLAADHDYKKM